MTNQKPIHLIFATLTGLIAYAIIGSLGLYLLQTCWADYAAHSSDKSMLFCRLGMGLLAAIATGIAATTVAKGSGKSAWFAGTIIFCVAAYVHLLTVTWVKYPVWYHATYLLPIVPVVRLSHRMLSIKRSVKNSD